MIAIDRKDGWTIEAAQRFGLNPLAPGTHHLTVLSMGIGAAGGEWVGRALLSNKWRRL